MTPVTPKPAASVVLVRPGTEEAVEVYLIRRHASMRFLAGYYAFPGGKVEAADAASEAIARCRGFSLEMGGAGIPPWDGLPPIAFWVAAIRELFEETGILVVCDSSGAPASLTGGSAAPLVERWRKALVTNQAVLTKVLAEADWFYHLSPLRYLSHFITPPASPIRFSARFFLASPPAGQAPRLFLEEASEGLWIGTREGYHRYRERKILMAEPAASALGYLSHFEEYAAVWQANADDRHKFHGIADRIETFTEASD